MFPWCPIASSSVSGRGMAAPAVISAWLSGSCPAVRIAVTDTRPERLLPNPSLALPEGAAGRGSFH